MTYNSVQHQGTKGQLVINSNGTDGTENYQLLIDYLLPGIDYLLPGTMIFC